MVRQYLERIPEGYSQGVYRGRKYALRKDSFNGGRSCKLFAEELGGHDFVSLNFYVTKRKEWLKPCEMPEEKVLDFLENLSYE